MYRIIKFTVSDIYRERYAHVLILHNLANEFL
jgi:hypothetical protein